MTTATVTPPRDAVGSTRNAPVTKMHCPGLSICTLALVLAVLPGWVAAQSPEPMRRPAPNASARPLPAGGLGAGYPELLDALRAVSPDLRAAALDTEAALARGRGAGLLPDPTFRLMLDETDRTGGRRFARNTASVEQEIPLWGKSDLQRDIAGREVEGMRLREAAALLDVEARLKLAFAEYFAAHTLGRETGALRASLRGMRSAAEARFTAGTAGPEDALQVAVEEARLEQDLIELDRQKRVAAARINALLRRPPGATLADPRSPRAVPAAANLQLPQLVEQLRTRHPMVAAGRAEAAAAEGTRRLAERGRFPDPVIGLGVIQREVGPVGFQATLGLRIPLQGGLRESQTGEAGARAAASLARADATFARLQAELEEAYLGLVAAQRALRVHHESVLPRAVAARRFALAAYETGGRALTPLLLAQRTYQGAMIELRREEVRQHALLAEIERLTGGMP